MTSHEGFDRRSSDFLRNPLSAVFWWGVPLAAGWSADFLPIPPSAETLVWAAALAWMGADCALNARRCHRLHCHIAAPVLFLGAGHVANLVDLVSDPSSDLPAEARPVLAVIAESLQSVKAKIAVLDREIAARAKANPIARRLMTIPGGARSSPLRSSRWRRRRRPFAEAATLPPGWGSHPNSTRAAAKSGSAERQRWASGACDGC